MVYDPCEDTYLIWKKLEQYAHGDVLDMGTGTGILACEAARYVNHVLAVDIDPKAILYCQERIKNTKIEFRYSDLFSKIHKDEKFDLIIFNPPYLPADEREDKESAIATTGGKYGWEIIENFLKEVRSYMKKNAKILMVFSSLTNKEKVDSLLEENGFKYKMLARQRVAFESLYLYLIW